MGGINRAALKADTSGMRPVSEKPLIVFLDQTERCEAFHEGFIGRGFESVIAETAPEAHAVVHEYNEYDEPRDMTVIFANPALPGVSGENGLVHTLHKSVFNRTICHYVADKINADLHEAARQDGALLVFERKPYSSESKELAEFKELLRVMLNYADHEDILVPRQSYEFDSLARIPTVGAFNRGILAAINLARRVLIDSLEGSHGVIPVPRVSLLAFDGDRFKDVNDQFGHHVGDRVIYTIGTAVRKVCRFDDLYCRAGGDEFRIALVNCEDGDALKLARRLRDSVRNESIDTETGKFIHPQLSYGISEAVGEQLLEGSPEEVYRALLVAADDHLYEAKPTKRRRKRRPLKAA